MGKILAIMVVYHPVIDHTLQNIQAIIEDVDCLLIWQNSTLSLEEQARLNISQKICLIGDSTNKGISYALNYSLSFAIENGYEYLLTMDQDSYWINFKEHKEAFFQLENRDNIIYGAWQKGAINKTKFPNIYKMRWVITSGTIYSVELLKRIGGFQQRFFVDSIDIELCLRATKFGCDIMANRNSVMRQTYGTPMSRRFLGRERKYCLYAPSRIKNIFMNLVLLYRKYKAKELITEFYDFSFLTWKAILLDRNTSGKLLKAYFIGITKGVFMKQFL